MSSTTLLRRWLQNSDLGWPLAQLIWRTPRRSEILRRELVELLSQTPTRVLAEFRDPSWLSGNCTRPRRQGDPLSIYWADLKRIQPTQREDEFIIARAIETLRETVRALIGEQPSRAARALIEEHLSPYAAIRQDLESMPLPAKEPGAEDLRLLAQRLGELGMLQNALIEHNLHAVPATARKYRHVGVPWEDLIQEGNASLLRAVERYDVAEGVRFSSYAACWIQQGILKALSFQSRTVRLPVYLAQAVHRVRNAQAQSAAPLSVEELAQRTDLSVEHVDRALHADRNCVSLQRPAPQDEDNSQWVDRLADERAQPDLDAVPHAELRGALDESLAALPEREALVLRLRFGMQDGRTWTLDEVRQHLGISRERVRQLQAQALGRLTRPTPRKRLSRYLDAVAS